MSVRTSYHLKSPANSITVEGRFIYLRPLVSADITDHYLNWLNDPETNQYLEVRHKKQTIEDIYHYINGLRSHKSCEIFGIFTKDQNLHVGNIALIEHDRSQNKVSYGILIGDKRGLAMGAGAEATCLMAEYVFSSLGADIFEAGVIAHNVKSWKTLESIGFKKTEVSADKFTLNDGEKSDGYIYQLTQDAWPGLKDKLRFIMDCYRVKEQ